MVCFFLELCSIQYQLQHLFLHPLVLSVVIRSRYKEARWTPFNTAVQFNVTELIEWTVTFVNYEKRGTLHMYWIGEHASGIRCSIYKWSCCAEALPGYISEPSDYSSYDIFQHSSQTMPIGDSTPTSRWPRTGRFVRTCWRTVLQYVENNAPLALKRSVAAQRFLNKICFNEGYLPGPKVCRSNLETPCISECMCLSVCQ